MKGSFEESMPVFIGTMCQIFRRNFENLVNQFICGTQNVVHAICIWQVLLYKKKHCRWRKEWLMLSYSLTNFMLAIGSLIHSRWVSGRNWRCANNDGQGRDGKTHRAYRLLTWGCSKYGWTWALFTYTATEKSCWKGEKKLDVENKVKKNAPSHFLWLLMVVRFVALLRYVDPKYFVALKT